MQKVVFVLLNKLCLKGSKLHQRLNTLIYRSHPRNGDSLEMECKSIQNNIFKCPSLEYKRLEKISETFALKCKTKAQYMKTKPNNLLGLVSFTQRKLKNSMTLV